MEDIWVWGGEKEEVYMIKYSYRKLNDSCSREDIVLFATLWSEKVLTFAQHFAWKVMLNRVATKENLKKRGCNLENDLYLMYGESVEKTNHLFFECKIARTVWNMCDV